MTRREMQALARIIAEHEAVAAQAVVQECEQGIPFPDTLKGCLATDDRILSEVLGMDREQAWNWRQRAVAWFKNPQVFKI